MDNVSIWKIENSLEEISELLKKSYKRMVNDKVYNNIWRDVTVVNDFQLINKERINFIKTFACIETDAITNSEILNVLPDTYQNTLLQSSIVYFVEVNDYTIAIIHGSKLNESKIRNRLMKSDKSETIKWGRVIYKYLPEFTCKKDFYYWIYDKKEAKEKFELADNLLEFTNIQGFRCTTARALRKYEGEGNNIEQALPLKSLICIDEDLVNFHITLLYNYIRFEFSLDFDYRLGIVPMRCGYFASANVKQLDTDTIILNIYFNIIPMLKTLHNVSLTNGWNSDSIRGKIAREVIKEIMTENHLSPTDIS